MTRIGRITQVYPAERMARVYFDELQTTSEKLPILAAKDYIPDVGKYVIVVMTGNKDGFVIGEYFYSDNPPDETTLKAVRYALGVTEDERKSYLRGEAGELELHAAEELTLTNKTRTITLTDLVDLFECFETNVNDWREQNG